MKILNYFIRIYIFWLVYFFLFRIFSLIILRSEINNIPFEEIYLIFPSSLRLDISFISYISLLFFLIIFVHSFISKGNNYRYSEQLINFTNKTLIIITSLIFGGEACLYAEWGTKLNFTALSHFSNPSEVFLTATFFNYLTIFFSLCIAFLFILIYNRIFKVGIGELLNDKLKVWSRVILFPIITCLFILLIRGGFQPIPINLSDSFFSKHMILNDVSVNPNWNLIQSIIKSKTSFNGNPYDKFSNQEIDDFAYKFFSNPSLDSHAILKINRPNIVFLVLESWSADNIESLGGLSNITPNFKELENDGLLFSNFYSNGWTSDQAVSSIFSSLPVLPYVSVINQSDKSRKLPCLNKDLAKINYHSSFFFGGQLTYGNIKAYLLSNNFDLVKDQEDYEHLPTGRLGVHDEYMFSEFIEELDKLPTPFVSTLFTLSSHSPYDFPGEHELSFNSNEDKYVNSVFYTDKCLGSFFSNIKNKTWYDSTLFIIVADHSHKSPISRRVAQKERFKIPMLWYGNVLKDVFKGSINNNLSSHIDITPTILQQLDVSNSKYKWGGNLFFNKKDKLIPYAFHKGYGLITNNSNYAFSESYSKVLEHEAKNKSEKEKVKKTAEMYFQLLFENYLNL